jgi:hypothetical protein
VPAFKQVFSITGKTFISLLIISLGIGIIWAVISVVSNRPASSPSAGSFEDNQADEASAKMPKSQWDAEVKSAIVAHCIFGGMSRAQVEQALGKINHNGAFEDYKQPSGRCTKYNGDACVEFDTNTMYLDFTKAGNFKETTFMSTYRLASASAPGKPIVCWAPAWTKDPPKTKTQHPRVAPRSTNDAK